MSKINKFFLLEDLIFQAYIGFDGYGLQQL
jgi:hypothetical protein